MKLLELVVGELAEKGALIVISAIENLLKCFPKQNDTNSRRLENHVESNFEICFSAMTKTNVIVRVNPDLNHLVSSSDTCRFSPDVGKCS